MANEWRSVCGDTPARLVWIRSRRLTSDVDSRLPVFEMNSAGLAPVFKTVLPRAR